MGQSTTRPDLALSNTHTFATCSLSPRTEGRNGQSTSDTRNSLITKGRLLPRAERPGASQFLDPAHTFRPLARCRPGSVLPFRNHQLRVTSHDPRLTNLLRSTRYSQSSRNTRNSLKIKRRRLVLPGTSRRTKFHASARSIVDVFRSEARRANRGLLPGRRRICCRDQR
jgi:hypothetical protein